MLTENVVRLENDIAVLPDGFLNLSTLWFDRKKSYDLIMFDRNGQEMQKREIQFFLLSFSVKSLMEVIKEPMW